MASVIESDCQLLARFSREADQAAFRSLVSRHGPGVLQVCRAVLHDPHAAEDAFQATFLVLVQKAPAIRDPELLGEWLRGVAYRTALHARSRDFRQKRRERSIAAMSEVETSSAGIDFDTRRIVRDELDQLPEEYRAPLVLFYLDGLSQEQVAARLRVPLGTAKTRISRGRRMLRERLDRRGLGLGVALLLWLLNPAQAEAAPEVLITRTVKGMRLAATGRKEELAARYTRAFELASAAISSGAAIGGRWLWLIMGMVVLLGGLAAPAVLAYQEVPPVPPAAQLPANLTDVLNVECR